MPARNDPCPCGSGKKYKRCCQPSDDRRRANLAVVPGLADRVHAGAGRPQPGAIWEAAVIPVPIGIDDAPDARPAAVLIVADDLPIHVNLLHHPPSEPGEIAAVVAGAVADAAGQHGVGPRGLRVAHPSVAEPLRAIMAEGVAVEARPLPQLDAVAAGLLAHLGARGAGDGKLAMASTWRAWGLPEATIRDLFVAAAAFYRAAPWRDLLNEQLLDLRMWGGGRWAACVLGNGGAEFGLALYTDRKDFERMARVGHPSVGLAALQDPMVSVTFSRRDELPAAMRKEVLGAGWEVAGTAAYPVLLTANTPAGGVTAAQAGDLAAALRAVPGFVAAHHDLLRSRRKLSRPVRWVHADTGVTVAYSGPAGQVFEPLWTPPDVLHPSLPVGPGACPELALDPLDPDLIGREHAELLARFTAAELRAGRAPHLVDRDTSLAELFLEFLAGTEGVPVTAVTEYDLRIFLYDWFPRKVVVPLGQARALPVALKRFLGFLGAAEGIRWPWAEAILADRGRFDERLRSFPGGFFWDEAVQEWQQPAYEDLDARALLADRTLGDGEDWGDAMGPVDYALHHELHRRWLLWREEAIREGITHPADVRAALLPRQRRWLATPHPGHGGRTPREVVLAERRDRT